MQGLVPGPDGESVAGVQLPGKVLTCDLVVVATGRSGQLPVWLEALGFRAPAEEKLMVDIRYASRHFHIPDGYLGRDKLILIGAEPGRPRGMSLFAQEDGSWLLTLVGYGAEHRPPTEDAGYVEFLASVAPADVLAGVLAAEPLDDVATHAFPASRRRRYERLSRFPRGLVALGDAVSSFNPVYGQGMSVAALQADALRQTVASGEDRLSQRYFKASGQDRRHRLGSGYRKRPFTPGGRRRTTDPDPAIERLGRAHTHRSRARPLCRGGLRQRDRPPHPPTVLMRPRFVWRVARSRAKKHVARGRSRVDDRDPSTVKLSGLGGPLYPSGRPGEREVDHQEAPPGLVG